MLHKFCPLPDFTNLPDIECQRDGIVKIGIGTSRVNPEMPQHWEQQRADNEHAGEDKDIPKDCKKKQRYNNSETLTSR